MVSCIKAGQKEQTHLGSIGSLLGQAVCGEVFLSKLADGLLH